VLTEGSLAPEFDLPAHDGSRVRLGELAGKFVVLWFYPEADTPG
jgi:peroxiredoxin Q/BCP